MPFSPNLDDQLCFALYAATNAVTRAYRPMLEAVGLTYPQYLVLLVLWQDGGCTPGHIARRLSLGANAITPLVDKLTKSGLLERKRDAGDRRVVRITVTERGNALKEVIAKVQGEVACRTGLPPEGVAAMRADLAALVRRMGGEKEEDRAPDTARI